MEDAKKKLIDYNLLTKLKQKKRLTQEEEEICIVLIEYLTKNYDKEDKVLMNDIKILQSYLNE
jgi:hypothetical protein